MPSAALVQRPPLGVPATDRRAITDALLERRTLRRLLDEVTGLVAGVAPGDRDRADLVARHLDEIVGMLEDHERAITRAGLSAARRERDAAAHVAQLRVLRGDLEVQLARLRLAVPYWTRGASAVCRDTAWAVLLDVGTVVDALFAVEESGILPFVASGDLRPTVVTEPWLGHLLETLTPAGRREWLRRRLTPSRRALWLLLGAPRFSRTRRRLRV